MPSLFCPFQPFDGHAGPLLTLLAPGLLVSLVSYSNPFPPLNYLLRLRQPVSTHAGSFMPNVTHFGTFWPLAGQCQLACHHSGPEDT